MPVHGLAADSFPERINHYVPAMKYAMDAVHMQPCRIDLGAPVVADADGILAAQSIAAVSSTTTFAATYASSKMGAFGRNVTVVASGAATTKVAVFGRDFLGQRMVEELTLNGGTPVVGKKAFKYIDKVEWEDTAATTINLGWGSALGLPYKCVAVEHEFEDDVLAGTTGTLIAGVTTDPATATTGDPRGTFTPNGTLDGSAEFVIQVVPSNSVNSDGNGGLHGIQHYNVASMSYT